MPCSPSKKKKRVTKNKKRGQVPKKIERKLASTSNGQLILDYMAEYGIKGKYKDHVILHGSQIIDWLGTYELAVDVEGRHELLGSNSTALIHKSRLKYIIGEEASLNFWKCNMRTNLGVESRRDGVAKSSK